MGEGRFGFGGKGVRFAMAEIGCNWARIGPSKSSQSLSIAHKWAVLRLTADSSSIDSDFGILDFGLDFMHTERDLLKIVKNGKLSREHKTVTCNKCNTKGHNSRSCTGPRVAKTNKRKVPTTGMDDTHAPTGSQANKRPKTQGVGSASGKTTNKGKAPAASGGVPKKTGPKKKVINLG
ncbi:mutator type transposase [Tanacetum coccineum]